MSKIPESSYYTPKIEDIGIGFRYEQSVHEEGEVVFFGTDKQPVSFSHDVWIRREIYEPILRPDLPTEIDLNKFQNLIDQKHIRTCKEFYENERS